MKALQPSPTLTQTKVEGGAVPRCQVRGSNHGDWRRESRSCRSEGGSHEGKGTGSLASSVRRDGTCFLWTDPGKDGGIERRSFDNPGSHGGVDNQNSGRNKPAGGSEGRSQGAAEPIHPAMDGSVEGDIQEAKSSRFVPRRMWCRVDQVNLD